MANSKAVRKRTETALALAASGLTQKQIAEQLGVSKQTIHRDIASVKPALEEAESKIAAMQSELNLVISLKERAGKYAQLAKNAKNEAVSLAALGRIDDLEGIVTQKELVRTRRDEASQPAAMFMLPPGTNVSVTVNAPKPQHIVDDGSKPVHNSDVIDVTPTESE